MRFPIKRVFRLGRLLYRSLFIRDENTLEHLRWQKDNASLAFYLSHPLDRSSIVFDVGGYTGKFAQMILHRYDCHLFVFEPVTEFFIQLAKRVPPSPRVQLFNYGLGANTSEVRMKLNDNSSKVLDGGSTGISIQIVSFKDFVTQHNVRHIDLLAMNIEGGEYELLEHMLSYDLHMICRNIMIQFHGKSNDNRLRREAIQSRLSQTHFLTFQYKYFWENWRRIED